MTTTRRTGANAERRRSSSKHCPLSLAPCIIQVPQQPSHPSADIAHRATTRYLSEAIRTRIIRTMAALAERVRILRTEEERKAGGNMKQIRSDHTWESDRCSQEGVGLMQRRRTTTPRAHTAVGREAAASRTRRRRQRATRLRCCTRCDEHASGRYLTIPYHPYHHRAICRCARRSTSATLSRRACSRRRTWRPTAPRLPTTSRGWSARRGSLSTTRAVRLRRRLFCSVLFREGFGLRVCPSPTPQSIHTQHALHNPNPPPRPSLCRRVGALPRRRADAAAVAPARPYGGR